MHQNLAAVSAVVPIVLIISLSSAGFSPAGAPGQVAGWRESSDLTAATAAAAVTDATIARPAPQSPSPVVGSAEDRRAPWRAVALMLLVAVIALAAVAVLRSRSGTDVATSEEPTASSPTAQADPTRPAEPEPAATAEANQNSA